MCQLWTSNSTHSFTVEPFIVTVIVTVLLRCLQASEVILTVYDKPTLRQLNAVVPPSCGWTSWKYGVPQIVSNTSGCPVLGVDVADFEADVVRVDRRHHWPILYLGHYLPVSVGRRFGATMPSFSML